MKHSSIPNSRAKDFIRESRWKFVSLLVLFFCKSSIVTATHSMGADLTYRSLGNNRYEITLTFYRDCVGIQVPPTDFVSVSSSCYPFPLNLIVRLVPGSGQEITPICPSAVSTCNGGTFTGIQQYIYRGVVTLPVACSDWTVSYDLCCRNAAITTMPNPLASNLNVYATIDNTVTQNDQSPVFSNLPVPFVCLGQQFCYSHGAYDADGDSIVYELIPPRGSSGVPLTYLPGYSAQQPLSTSPAMTFNTETGDFCFTPQMMEVTVMAVLVKQYRNGVLIGSVERDIQVTVINCTNVLPQASGINGTNSFSISACADQPLCFDINSSDTDSLQNVTFDWDSSIPGAAFLTGTGGRPTATFCWTPTQSDIGSSRCFTATVTDDACPIYGIQTYTYCIDVGGPLVDAGPDITFGCNGQTTIGLNAIASNGTAGNYAYQWSNGATTASTTVGIGTHIVSVTSGGCTSLDTVLVSPPPPPPVASFNSNSPCVGSPIAFNNTSTSSSPIVQYSWASGGGVISTAVNPSFTFPSAGSYPVTLTVTDVYGCSSSFTGSVTVQSSPVITISPPSSICQGQSVTLTASGGTSYSWSPGSLSGASVTVSPAQSQTYQVLVTNSFGCTGSGSVVVNVNPLPGPTVSTQPVLCSGGTSGQANVQPVAGSAPFTFLWSNGATGPSVSGLAAGSYSVVLTDAVGCSSSASFNVTEPAPLVLAASGIDPSCAGSSSGAVSVSVSGGASGYDYLWSPSGGTTSTTGQVAAGVYSVIVTDNNGCTSSASVAISDPPPVTISLTATPSTCGVADGTLTAVSNGGSGTYVYDWPSGVSSSGFMTGLGAGTYVVTVTDGNGCSNSATAIIPNTAAPVFAPSVIQDVSCHSGSDGAAQVGTITGNGPYSYNWSNGSSASSVSGITSGIYSVVVTDVNGCMTSADVIIQEPPPLVSSISVTDVLCFAGNDGAATAIISGGTPGYDYLWSGSPISGPTISGLSAGNYSAVFTDANGCTVTGSFVISQPPPVLPALSSIPATCYGASDGSAFIVGVPGSVTPIQVLWPFNGSTSDTLSAVSAGIYQVQVVDGNGCTSSSSVTVNEPSPLTALLSGSDPTCSGSNDGTLIVVPSGGVQGYSVIWSTGSISSYSLTGIAAGVYSVTVSDSNGCATAASVSLLDPLPLMVSVSTQPATCGLSDGSATINVSGGTSPYNYNWSTGLGSSVQVSGLTSGNYSVTVTDANGCNTTANAIVTNIGAPQLEAAVLDDVSCHSGSDGIAVTTLLTGNGPFTFNWSNGSVDDTLSGVPAGVYSLTLTDVNGCQAFDTLTIDEPDALISSVSTTDVSCFGLSNGSATVSVSGGTPGYSFVWTGSTSTNTTALGFPAGVHSVVITDINGCTITTGFSINQPPAILLSVFSDSTSCNGSADGSLSVFVANGTSPFTYDWAGIGMDDDTLEGLLAGSYSVIVTDADGCTATASAAVNEPASLVVSLVSDPVSCHNGSDGSVTVTPSGGTPGYTYSWMHDGSISAVVSGLSAGVYTVEVMDDNGCEKTESIAVQQPSVLNLSTTSTPATCGVPDGTVAANPTGGTAPYTFEWAPGQITTQVANNLFAGGYGVLVTDANGCTQSGYAQVPNIGAPTMVAMTAADVSCAGGSDGLAVVQSATGNGPFAFVWGNGLSGDSAVGLVAGIYSVIMTDVNGCVTTDTVQVTEPSPLQISITAVPVSCFSGNDGSITVSVSGGVSGYTFQWSNGQSSGPGIYDLSAGSYSATATDLNGCSISAVIDITQPPGIQVQTVAASVLCHGASDGSAYVSASGGTGIIDFLWIGSTSTADTVYGLSAGYYSVIATDANGCTVSDSVFVTEPPTLTVSVSTDSVSCSGFSDGALQAFAAGGVGGYSFSWSPLSSFTSELSGVPAGVYQVFITDTNGCTSSATTAVVDPSPLWVTVNQPPVICIGQSTTLIATAGGGTWPFAFNWSTGDTDDSIMVSPLVTTAYTVTITDANGCSLAPQSVSVTVNPPLSVDVSDPAEICEGGSVQISSVASGGNGGPYAYSWNYDAIQTANATVAPMNDSTFTVNVSDGCSPDATAAVSVIVHPLPDVEFTPQQFVGCTPVTVQLSNIHTVPPGSVFSWDLDDTVSSDVTPSYTYVAPGYYDLSLSITTPEGCSDQVNVTNAVHVFGYPTAIFEQSTESISVFTPSVELQDMSIDAVTWSWDFGDGTSLDGDPSPTHVYSDSGYYTIRLIVTNEGGCPDTVFGVVRIEPEFTIFIPNAFTPNGDGRNDYFFPIGENIVRIEMWILDRWGLEIFHSTSFDLQWDGTYHGSQPLCQNDVYEYVVDAVDFTGKVHRYIGHVTLVR